MPASATGRVQLWVDRVMQTDYAGDFRRVSTGKTYNPFDENSARHGARSADVNWRS